uniref:Transmembrane 9 superfamily member n=1 Tax=Steinernema glaseri TaxID=37863 RepID=A0A1I7YYQ5_9BILA
MLPYVRVVIRPIKNDTKNDSDFYFYHYGDERIGRHLTFKDNFYTPKGDPKKLEFKEDSRFIDVLIGNRDQDRSSYHSYSEECLRASGNAYSSIVLILAVVVALNARSFNRKTVWPKLEQSDTDSDNLCFANAVNSVCFLGV